MKRLTLYAAYDRDGRRVFTSAFRDFAEASAGINGTVRKFVEVELEQAHDASQPN